MPETHKIEIAKDGKVTITVTGVSGSACKASTARLQALGTVLSTEPTEEMYANENVQAVNRS